MQVEIERFCFVCVSGFIPFVRRESKLYNSEIYTCVNDFLMTVFNIIKFCKVVVSRHM